jgi:dinuclear metal center YbgI/SA1388 family protein
MKIAEITSFLETIAPLSLQEGYDNAGLITGHKNMECTGALISLDCTEAVIDEAIAQNKNLLIAHHPIIFKGLKKINGNNYIEQAIIKAIKNDIAIYAIHTNLDNILTGVNGKIAEKIGLTNCSILAPKTQLLQLLTVYVPTANANQLKNALFAAGAGHIGNYSECSFSSQGVGSFKPMEGSNPKKGEHFVRDESEETKLELIMPNWLQANIVKAMKENHPYEEVAYQITNLENNYQQIGAGLIGSLPQPMAENELFSHLGKVFNLKAIKHTAFLGKKVQKIAICGGAGSFLIPAAKAAGAGLYITADLKYHEFFDADNQLVLADIGHFESEQYTIDLVFDLLSNKFRTFALQKTGINTNPVELYIC